MECECDPLPTKLPRKIYKPGKLKIKKNNKMTYRNKAGSRGKVTLEGSTLTFRNVYTGNSYKVIVKK